MSDLFEKNRVYTDEELFSSLKDHVIKVEEKLIQMAKNNDGQALYYIGTLHCNSKDNFTKAVTWFYKAALQGHAAAQSQLGFMYQHGWGVSVDYKEAMNWFMMAAKQGHSNSQDNIGHLYHHGLGVPKDIFTAVEWHKKAVDGQNIKALYNIGYIYENEYQVKDLQEAIEWYQKAATNNVAGANQKVIELNERGYYAKDMQVLLSGSSLDPNVSCSNDQKSEEEEKHAKEEKDKSSHEQLDDGELFSSLNKDGINLTYNELQKAKENDPQTVFDIGENYYYFGKSEPKAFKWIYKAALQNHAEAQFYIGLMYENERGVPKDYELSLEWYQKAASQGHLEAQNNIGWAYQNGLGITLDYKQAMHWFMKAANAGCVDAQNNVGWAYHNGFGVSVDFKKAMEWYMRAESKSACAQDNIGSLYHKGLGVSKNIHTAIEWHTKAANRWEKDAPYNLGYIYETEDEVRDLQEAVNWYQWAAYYDDEKAKRKVEELNERGYYAKYKRKGSIH